MSDLVGNLEDRFSRVAAHITQTCYPDVPDILTAGSIIMASDKNNQYLVTGDVDGLIKVWEILEYATHSVSEPVTTPPRKYS